MLNTIIQGDCLEIMKQIPDKSIDMVLCDLPYGTTQCKWDTVIPFAPLWEQYARICIGAVVLTGSEPFSSLLRVSNLSLFKYDWIWEKSKATGHLDANRRPLKKHEIISVFGNLSIYNPQGLVVKEKPTISKGDRGKKGVGSSGECYGLANKDAIQTHYNYPKSIIPFNVDMKAEFHPTQKPVALFEYLIKTYTNPGDTVLDNCIGSGTTAIACINTGRNFIGIEKEEKYVKIAQDRVARLHATNGTKAAPVSPAPTQTVSAINDYDKEADTAS